MIVPLPPKPAPKTSAHHNGSVFIPDAPRPWIIGMRAIVTGTLSTTAEIPATNQIRITPNKTGATVPKLLGWKSKHPGAVAFTLHHDEQGYKNTVRSILFF
jgi:hypothetical protein